MLTPVINNDDTINPLGLLQAWTGVYAMYKLRPFGLLAILDEAAGEKLVKYWQLGIDQQDGGIAIVQSGNMAYIFVGPATGLVDYAAFALTGVRAIASSVPQCWGNVLWLQYLTAIRGLIQAQLVDFLPPGGKVQVVGFSQGGAMAMLLGRSLSQGNIPYQVDAVGFGAPRSIADLAPVQVGKRTARIVNMQDPVDLVPPTSMITPIGGPLPGLPTPAAWANIGTRYVIDQDGAIAQVNDPPSPPDLDLLADLVNNIGMHSGGSYTQSVANVYAASGYPGGAVGACAIYAASALINEDPILLFGPQQLKAPQLPVPVNQQPAIQQQSQFLIQEMVIPVPVPPAQQFLIQEMVIPGFSIPPSLTKDPG